MIEDLPTVVLDDDERTIVDTRLSSRARRMKRRFARSCWEALRPRRALIANGVIALSVLGAGVWAHSAHRQLELVRRELDALKRTTSTAEPAPSDATLKPLGSSPEVRGRRPAAPDSVGSHSAVLARPEVTVARGSDSTLEVSPASAADLVIRNRLTQALRSYRRLATSRPDEPVYADTVRILEAKLTCSRGLGGLGAPCAR